MKRNRLTQAIATAMCTTALLSGCDDDSDNQPFMRLSMMGLENLGATHVYEGWIVTDSGPVSTGRFSVDSAGMLSQTDFAITPSLAANADTFVLTIEPAVGDVPAPTDTHLVAGDFNSGSTVATLSTNHPAALNTNFSAVSGSFILATPSTASVTTDEGQGIWWLNMPGPVSSLTLPALPAGWTYEGWVVVGGTPVSTGVFTNVAMADSDGKGAMAGPDGTPPFPGQDFITPPTVLTGGMAVISIEPVPDNSAMPFAIKPLMGSIGTDLAPTAQNMFNAITAGNSVLPTGSASIYQ